MPRSERKTDLLRFSDAYIKTPDERVVSLSKLDMVEWYRSVACMRG